MKSLKQIQQNIKIRIQDKQCDGINGYVNLGGGRQAAFVMSRGCGWEHLSVSYPSRCPTWDEMSTAKRMFFNEDDVCIQIHPRESEYVNNHPYVLHIWRPIRQAIPIPPTWMVGLLPGQTMSDIMRMANEYEENQINLWDRNVWEGR